MEEKYNKILRYSILGIGIIFLILLIINLVSIFQLLTNKDLINSGISNISLMPLIIYSVLIYICFKIAFNWDSIFKSLTKTLVSFAILFLTIFFVLVPIGNNTNEIVESIQPTIDTILVLSIDDILSEQFPVVDKELNLSFSKSNKILMIDNNNLSTNDINIISNLFELNSRSFEEKTIFTKIFVTIIYEQISKDSRLKDIPISLVDIKDMISNQVNLNLLKSIDVKMLNNFYQSNDNARIRVIVDENVITKTVNPNELNDEDLNLIWDNLNLDNNISIQTKRKIIALILSETAKSLDEQNIDNDMTISVSAIGYMIPEDLNSMFSYDLFANDTQTRVEALNELRTDCKNQTNFNEYSEEICKNIIMTEYDSLINNLDEITNDENILPVNINEIIEPISTKKKIENKLNNINLLAYKFLICALILFGLAFLSYYLHFKLFNRELINIHIPYYISKINLISYIFNYVGLLLIYLVINKNYFLKWMETLLGGMDIINFSFITNLPIFAVIKLINSQMIIYGSFYLLFSIVNYIIFYYLQKKAVENENFRQVIINKTPLEIIEKDN